MLFKTLSAIKFYILYSKFPITGWGARPGRQGRLSLVAQVASFISLPITIICGLLTDAMASRVPIIILLRMRQTEIFWLLRHSQNVWKVNNPCQRMVNFKTLR